MVPGRVEGFNSDGGSMVGAGLEGPKGLFLCCNFLCSLFNDKALSMIDFVSQLFAQIDFPMHLMNSLAPSGVVQRSESSV